MRWEDYKERRKPWGFVQADAEARCELLHLGDNSEGSGTALLQDNPLGSVVGTVGTPLGKVGELNQSKPQ